jgi:hypothetical protein
VKRRLLVVIAVGALAGIARGGTVDLRRGVGSWTSPITNRDLAGLIEGLTAKGVST